MKRESELGEWEKETLAWIRRKRPTIYCTLRYCSLSGMFRVIDFFALRHNQHVFLTGLISAMADYKRDKGRYGLRVSGRGRDMGFEVVYNFSCACFPNGFRYRKGESHRNNDPSPIDKDGGYALKHQWL